MKPDGLEAAVVSRVLNGEFEACVSEAVWREYLDVLSRPKFEAWAAQGRLIVGALEGCVVFVNPADSIAIATDEDDNRFLECAHAAGAQFLVTANLRHFPERLGLTRIVNAREFLAQGKPVR